MILDLLIVVLVLFFVIIGYKNGFIKSAFNLIKLVIVVYFTPMFLPTLELLTNIQVENIIVRYLAYVVIFIVLYLLVSILINMLTKLISITPFGIINKLLGAIFGLVKSSIIIVLTIIILLFISDKIEKAKKVLDDSILIEYISIYSGTYNALFPGFIKHKLDHFRNENLEKNFKRNLLREIEEGI